MKRIFVIIIMFSTSLVTHAQTLEEYFTIAAENNPGLQAKYLNFEAAMQQVSQYSSLPDPSLSFAYFISPVETRVGPQLARFSLSQMFPWFGTLKEQESTAALMAESMYKDFLDARNKLYYQVAAAYYPLYELERFKSIETENISILSSYKEIASIKFENGESSMVDVLRVDIMLNDAQSNLQILKQQERPLVSSLNSLLNRPGNDSIILNVIPTVVDLADAYRRDSILELNPLLAGLDLKIEASKARERAATKQGLPKLGLGLDYIIVGDRPDVELADNGQDAFAAMVSVSIPLFRAKYKDAQVSAQLMQESYALQKEDLSNKLLSNYDITWFELQKQAEFISLYNQQIQESQQSLNLLFSSYGNSGKDFEEVLRMQQQLLKYEKLKASALVNYHIALAKIEYITAKSR